VTRQNKDKILGNAEEKSCNQQAQPLSMERLAQVENTNKGKPIQKHLFL